MRTASSLRSRGGGLFARALIALVVTSSAGFASGVTSSSVASSAVSPAHPAVAQSIDAGARIAGCALFPANNPWRRDITHAPLSPHSAAWVRSVGRSVHLHPDFGSNPSYGIPVTVVPAGQRRLPIRFTAYGSESDPGPYPVPHSARIEAGSDRHVLVASRNCHLYELYGAHRTTRGWAAASGAVFDLRSNRLRHEHWTSADAAGLPITAGLVRPAEIRAGRIDHALRFTVAATQRGYIHPATHQAGSTNSVNVPPMGARFRLKASFSLRGYHGAARIILVALKHYGMIVADNGSDWFISGATWRGWNDNNLDELKRVPGSAFQVVQTGRIRH